MQCAWAGSIGIQYCPGAYDGYCHPYIVWSSLRVGDSNAWAPELVKGSFTEYYEGAGLAVARAFSVRCLLLARYPATYEAEISSLSPQTAVLCVLGFDFIRVKKACNKAIFLIWLQHNTDIQTTARAPVMATATRVRYGQAHRVAPYTIMDI